MREESGTKGGGGALVDIIELHGLDVLLLLGHDHCDGCRERRLPVVDVPDRSNVQMRLRA